MQMIDVMKRLAELDAQNPNIVKESTQAVEECGMMGSMGSQPHTPASINMTAASGEELSSMLKDIMTLAGKSEPMSVEPVKGANGIATVDMGMNDEPSVMRSMLDKLNPGDDEDEPKDEKPVEEYDNSPDVETQGYDSMVPSGNDLHREKRQYPAAQPGDNAMSMEESLMNEWKKFVAEGSDQGVAEGTGVTDYNPKSQGGTRKELLAKYHKTKNPKDAEAARKAGATQKELQGVEEGSESEQEYHDRMHRLAAGYHGMDPQRRAKMEKIPGWKDQYDQALAYVEKHPKNDQQGVAEGSKHASRPGTEKKTDANESLDILKLAGLK